MDPMKANPGDVNLRVFDAKKLREAVKAIQEQPKLTGRELLQMKHERDTLTACFDEVTAMMQPLHESYVRLLQTLGPEALSDFNNAGGDRLDTLRKQIEPLQETLQKSVVARDARAYLHLVLEECLKLADLVTYSRGIEKGGPPKAGPFVNNPKEDV
ncbi:hypothetical protein [Burkholderia anthina]|uniref:hypothetical protein n=1 Tax=Burkholderia anthina TaxID=179879 RepID=UPI001AA06BBB|nr:hypothetical protein [Burkholderia anthina]QTD91289.1 hypothetical protein J4G50_07925 [Burkholderia anthina]